MTAMHGPANSIVGPAFCEGCRELVWWARSWTRDGWNGPVIPSWLAWREQGGRIHVCKFDGRTRAGRAKMKRSGQRTMTRVAGSGLITRPPPAA